MNDDAHSAEVDRASALVRAVGLAFSASALPQWLCERASLRCLAVNDAALAAYGYDRQTMLSLTMTRLHAADEQDAVRSCFAGEGEVSQEFSSRVWRHQASTGDIFVRMVASVLPVGDTPVLLIQVMDLGAEVARAREADAARQTAEHLLTIVGHELRQPLTPIMTAVRVLELEVRRDAAVEALKVMTRQLHVLKRLVEDLFNTSRARRGTIILEREPEDLRLLIKEAELDHAGEAAAHGLTLVTSLPSIPVWASVDRNRFREIVSNLIANAIRHSPAGGCVRLRVAVGDDRCHVVVSDEGDGIAPDVLPHVFELFARTDSGQRSPGLGVGLSVVRTLVDLHGGRVEASSAGKGAGAEFIVTLPTCGPPASATALSRLPLQAVAERIRARSHGDRERLTLEIEDVAVALVVADARGQLLGVNRAGLALTGYSARSIGTLQVLDVLSLDTTQLPDTWEPHLVAGCHRGILSVRCRDGARVPARYYATRDICPDVHLVALEPL